MGAGCNIVKQEQLPSNTNNQAQPEDAIEESIDGEQNNFGCLSELGYSYDELVKACIKPGLNKEKKQVAKLAVEYLTADEDIYGLMVVEVIPARCPGCWHVDLSDAKGRQFELSVTNGVVKDVSYDYFGDLVDVSGGEASGTARAYFNGQEYILVADFNNLPDPESGYFYEGWVVRKQPLSVISTGSAKSRKLESTYQNTFISNQDLTDHDFYVLTIEPDDGDPAPAAHILEGTMIK